MIKKLTVIFCFFLPGIVLGQKTTNFKDFSIYTGIAIFNSRPSIGISFGNSFIFKDANKKHFFETSIRYTFAHELQKELSRPTFFSGFNDHDPKFNSVVSTVDLFQNIGYTVLKKEKVILSLSTGLGIRKWSEVRNGDIVISKLIDPSGEYDLNIRYAPAVYNKVWQLGGNVSSKVEFLPSKKISFGYKTQYCFYHRNNSWYNELYFTITISKPK